MSHIHQVREMDTGLTYMVMSVPVPEMLDAIKANPFVCPDCDADTVVQIPVDTPLQWDVLTSHQDGCPTGERIVHPELPVASSSTHTL
jgi:hypothetical protein